MKDIPKPNNSSRQAQIAGPLQLQTRGSPSKAGAQSSAFQSNLKILIFGRSVLYSQGVRLKASSEVAAEGKHRLGDARDGILRFV